MVSVEMEVGARYIARQARGFISQSVEVFLYSFGKLVGINPAQSIRINWFLSVSYHRLSDWLSLY